MAVYRQYIEFYRVLPSFTELSFTEFYHVLPSFTTFYRVLPSFTEFYLVLPSFTECTGRDKNGLDGRHPLT